MRTTIDAAGRIVVPKSVREAMGLTAGRQVDVFYTDGKIEIEIAPADVVVEMSESGIPRIVYQDDVPELTDEMVRDTIESTRR